MTNKSKIVCTLKVKPLTRIYKNWPIVDVIMKEHLPYTHADHFGQYKTMLKPQTELIKRNWNKSERSRYWYKIFFYFLYKKNRLTVPMIVISIIAYSIESFKIRTKKDFAIILFTLFF